MTNTHEFQPNGTTPQERHDGLPPGTRNADPRLHGPWTDFAGWAGPPAEETRSETVLRRFVRRFLKRRVAVVAMVYLTIITLAAILAPLVAPYDPLHQDLHNVLKSPTSSHPFGTDEIGRDVLSRMIFGARVSLLAAGQAVVLAVVLGVIPGLLAGFVGGWVDAVISRITDAIMSFPPLLLAIAIVGVFGPNLRNAMIAVGIIFAPRFLRLVRASVLVVKEETFVEASRSIGTPTAVILRSRILPNILSPLIVQVSLSFGFAMLAEASLSFLGLGVQPPDASWGAMVGRGYQFLELVPSLVLFPGAGIALTVLAFNILGDGVRDSFGRETRTAGR
ncbi:MAG: oligopeptide transporter permease protein [Aeromicrobium sp.]|nr:oligopeptide transporter permease protein [Aeromicrobium sp.]